MNSRLRTALGVILFVTATSAPATGQGTGPTYVDETYGYSVSTVKGWEQIPVEPDEKITVARWTAPRAERNFRLEMHVHVFEKPRPRAAKDTEKTAGGYERDTTKWEPGLAYKRWGRWRRRGLVLNKPKRLKLKKLPKDVEITAQLFECEFDSGMTMGGRSIGNYYYAIGIIHSPYREWVVELSGGAPNKKKYRATFLRVIKSFRVRKAPQGRQSQAVEPNDPREAARARARKDVTRTKGWWYVESPNYIIVTDIAKKRKPFINELRARLEAIRNVYERDFPPANEITAVSIVRVCKDRQTYMNYGAPGGSAGYWSSAAKELVLYAGGNKNTARAVLMHEAFHQYIYYACGEISPHSWYNEGYGDYYAGAVIQGSRFARIAPFSWRTATIKAAIRTESYVPLEKLIRYTQRQYYAKADLCYAQGWSLIYFLNKGIPKNHAWRQILPTYLEVLQKEYNDFMAKDETGEGPNYKQEAEIRSKAVEAAFKDVDIAELEKAWAKFTAR